MDMTQIPRGPSDLYCPLWRKSMGNVCHTCPWWMQVRGIDRNTGAEIDRWMCAIAATVKMTHEAASNSRESGAAVDSLRNDLLAMHAGSVAAMQSLYRHHNGGFAIEDKRGEHDIG